MTTSVTAAQIAQVRRMVNEPTTATYADAAKVLKEKNPAMIVTEISEDEGSGTSGGGYGGSGQMSQDQSQDKNQREPS